MSRLGEPGLRTLLAPALIAGVIGFHLVFAFSAGGLWRDEANSIHQAQLPGWGALWQSLRYDSFPALYPALLRLYSALPWGENDAGLRFFGLTIGLALAAAIWITARSLHPASAGAVFLLSAAHPLLISEGDSIRPYGLSLLALVWAYAASFRLVARTDLRSMVLASAAALAAVQASYVNAIHVAVILLASAAVSALDGKPQPWLRLLPGIPAALSLLPFAGTLHAARAWASIAGVPGEWGAFARGYLRTFTWMHPAVWGAFILLGAAALLFRAARNSEKLPPAGASLAFAAIAGGGALAAQLGLVRVFHLPLFPRYFLATLVLLSFPAGIFASRARASWLRLLIAAGMLVSLWPSLAVLTVSRTNADRIAQTLERHARPGDLVLVSPWFLHTSFQRYYHGEAEWATVPELEREPMMRYDLVGRAILDPERMERASARLESVLARGGRVWLVSQREWTDLARARRPERPEPPAEATAESYVRFRSYWESTVEFLLAAGGRCEEVPLAGNRRRTWAEEDLLLTRWTRS